MQGGHLVRPELAHLAGVDGGQLVRGIVRLQVVRVVVALPADLAAEVELALVLGALVPPASVHGLEGLVAVATGEGASPAVDLLNLPS